jgi:hypothetical protein
MSGISAQPITGLHTAGRRCRPAASAAIIRRAERLFDRNRQPPDQPCHLVERFGIMILHCLRQQSETLVVAHHRRRAPVDQRACTPEMSSCEISMKARHPITSKNESVGRDFRRRMRRFGAELMASAEALPQSRHIHRWPRSPNAAKLRIWKAFRTRVTPGCLAHFPLCKPWRLCYTQPVREDCFAPFLGSSAVEHSTVNRMVAGSNPARGAKQNQILTVILGVVMRAIFSFWQRGWQHPI